MRAKLARPMFVAKALSEAIASPIGCAAVVLPASVVPGIFAFIATHTRIEKRR